MNDSITLVASAAAAPFADRHHRYLRLARRRQRRRHLRLTAALALTAAASVAGWAWVVHSICPQGPRDTAREETRFLAEAAMAIRARTGQMPRTMADIVGEMGSPGLSTGKHDPWGLPYAVVSPPLRSAWGVNIVSAGPDRTFFTDDDVGNWDE